MSIENRRQRRQVSKKVWILFKNDGVLQTWVNVLMERGVGPWCTLSMRPKCGNCSIAYILNLDTRATMTSKVLHNTLISTYLSTVLQPAAILEAAGFCVSACLFHPLDIMLSVLPPPMIAHLRVMNMSCVLVPCISRRVDVGTQSVTPEVCDGPRPRRNGAGDFCGWRHTCKLTAGGSRQIRYILLHALDRVASLDILLLDGLTDHNI